MQEAAIEAIEGLSGKHRYLAASDPRLKDILKPVAALVQTQADWGIRKEKAWPTPSTEVVTSVLNLGLVSKSKMRKIRQVVSVLGIEIWPGEPQ